MLVSNSQVHLEEATEEAVGGDEGESHRHGRGYDWTLFEWSFLGSYQLFSEHHRVSGVRLNLLGGGDNYEVHGLDVGLVGCSGGIDGISANLLYNRSHFGHGLQLGLYN